MWDTIQLRVAGIVAMCSIKKYLHVAGVDHGLGLDVLASLNITDLHRHSVITSFFETLFLCRFWTSQLDTVPDFQSI